MRSECLVDAAQLATATAQLRRSPPPLPGPHVMRESRLGPGNWTWPPPSAPSVAWPAGSSSVCWAPRSCFQVSVQQGDSCHRGLGDRAPSLSPGRGGACRLHAPRAPTHQGLPAQRREPPAGKVQRREIRSRAALPQKESARRQARG